MVNFSTRYGYRDSTVQYECASDTLKRRIMAAFYKQEFDSYDTMDWTNYTTRIEDMMIEMGVPYEFPKNEIFKKKNAEALQEYIFKAEEWYIIYDFIERYLKVSNIETITKMEKVFNEILEEEVSGYRIVDGLVVPITSKAEIETVKEACNTPYHSVNVHIEKAIELFANRKKPDYENSIKESISAVESICCVITNSEHGTLGKTLKKLKDNGVHIHSAMESAFSSLYGYTSDEDGIRHGSIDFHEAPIEDARYMLITCSAFVNYLMEKYRSISA